MAASAVFIAALLVLLVPIAAASPGTSDQLLPATGEAAPKSHKNSIRFVFWNLNNLRSPPSEENQRGTSPKAHIEAAARVLASLEPHIIGMAEIADFTALRALQIELQNLGCRLPHHLFLEGPDTERRLALLSFYPIKANHSKPRVTFEIAGTPAWMRRGILDAEIALPGLPSSLRCVGVHFKSGREDPAASETSAFRSREARALREHLDEIFAAAPEATVLLWGDLNMARNDPAFSILAGPKSSPTHMAALPLEDQHGLRWTHHWAAADFYSRIDYILASPAARKLVNLEASGIADSQKASDHRPLFIQLEWQASNPF